MTYRPILLIGLALLAGCAHQGEPELPVCDGSARRPANPHGSVLTLQAAARPPADNDGSEAGGCA